MLVTKMRAKIIRMELLNEEEAWALFKDKAGNLEGDPDLHPIAKNIVAECKGLPIALINVGVALKDKSIHEWKDSLIQLRRSIPTDFPEVLEDVYKPLKLSYDFLETESFKSLFLLCCLFPEDYNIPIEHLTLYSFGLRMFEGIRDIEEGRIRTNSVVEKLKSRFLLLDDGHRWVKMHDVVRDVAIFIGSKEKDGFLMNSLEAFSMDSSSKDSSRNCNWMSIDISTENAKLLVVGSDFPNLRFMMVRGEPNKAVDGNNVICFEGMQGLKVLSISDVYFQSLPPTMELLKELRTLRLGRCFVKDISVLGELACLEILCIIGCHNIEELPADIGRLNFLILLELDFCRRLRRIAAGVISSLVRLEELKIVGCLGFKWEAKGNQSEERNAGLWELEYLPNLTSLEIDISDCNLLAEEICLSQKLVRYRIRSRHLNSSTMEGQQRRLSRLRYLYGMEEYERGIGLYLPGDIVVGNWIRQLAKSTQSLELEGGLSIQLPVKPIKLVGLEEIIYGTVPEVSNFIQKLESIRIDTLPKLAHLWKSQNQNVSLGNLKSINIWGCADLCNLFSVATARSLAQLERLEIEDCDKIEQVFWNGMESNTDASIIVFPKLQELGLSNLPNLAAFSQGVESIESLHQLTRLTIKDCPKLRTKIGKCPNLRFVDFSGPHQLLYSHHMIEELVISACDSIEEILWDEIKDEGERRIIFPELKKLELCNLPCFTTFCSGVESIEFPKLEEMRIGKLPRLKSLLAWDLEAAATHDDHHSPYLFCNAKNVSLGNLKSISIEGCPNLCYLFSVATARSLVQLERLEIEDCDKIEQVFWNGMEINTDASIIEFPNLRNLRLSNLPNLAAFSQGAESMEFPKLERMTIGNLPRLNSLLPLDLVETTHHDHHSLHFFCNPKVEIPGLTALSLVQLHNTISKIWCRHVPINFFHNLERLSIVDVNGISNLISSSIAKNLMNLNYLHIEGCHEMVDVINDEKEVFAMTPFHNLGSLYIRRLHKLRSFCQWTHTLELPSLRNVTIDDCPGMKTFTLGSLSTPSLYYIIIDHKLIVTKDLNGGIRDWFRIKTENKEEHEDEDNKKAEGEEKIE